MLPSQWELSTDARCTDLITESMVAGVACLDDLGDPCLRSVLILCTQRFVDFRRRVAHIGTNLLPFLFVLFVATIGRIDQGCLSNGGQRHSVARCTVN